MQAVQVISFRAYKTELLKNLTISYLRKTSHHIPAHPKALLITTVTGRCTLAMQYPYQKAISYSSHCLFLLNFPIKLKDRAQDEDHN